MCVILTKSEQIMYFCERLLKKMPENTISNWLFAKLSVMCRHSNTSSLVLGVFLSLVSVKWCKKTESEKVEKVTYIMKDI